MSRRLHETSAAASSASDSPRTSPSGSFDRNSVRGKTIRLPRVTLAFALGFQRRV
jgi:hypothetical protein